jgi:Tropinone reductase 1
MIRYAIVGELAALGAIVHTCGRSQDQLNENLREWKAKGFKVTGSVCDLSSDAEREKLMEEVSSLFDGKLDILVSKISLRFLFAQLIHSTWNLHNVSNLHGNLHLDQDCQKDKSIAEDYTITNS